MDDKAQGVYLIAVEEQIHLHQVAGLIALQLVVQGGVSLGAGFQGVKKVRVDNPHNYPDPGAISQAREPYAKVSIISPPDYVGNIMPMCQASAPVMVSPTLVSFTFLMEAVNQPTSPADSSGAAGAGVRPGPGHYITFRNI